MLERDKILKTISEIDSCDRDRELLKKAGRSTGEIESNIIELKRKLIPTDDLYSIPATMEDVDKLTEIFFCDFIIGMGWDRSKAFSLLPDRTVGITVARGFLSEEVSIYFLLDLVIPETPIMSNLTDIILTTYERYGWIDKIAIEEFQGQDLHTWCTEQGFESELTLAAYKHQYRIFSNLYSIVNEGLFKAPAVPYWTSDKGEVYEGYPPPGFDDIFRQELGEFYAEGDEKKGKFGAPEKSKKGKSKDDTIYSLAWAVHATQGEGLEAASRGGDDLIEPIVNKDVVGNYD